MSQKVGIGVRFGRLVVLRKVPSKRRDKRWLCRCDCGNTHEMYTFSLNGGTRSCGCLGREQLDQRTSHGLARKVPEYQVWEGMIQRCTNPGHTSYKNYGAKSVTICAEWRDFARFYADMGSRPTPKHTLDRIDGSLVYGPGLCRWATRIEQNNTTNRNRLLEFEGRTQTVAQWARELGIPDPTVRSRLYRGYPIEKVLEVQS